MRGKTFESYYDQALKLLSNRPHALSLIVELISSEKELYRKLQSLSTKRWTRRTVKSRSRVESASVFTNEATPRIFALHDPL